jgi:hypothetical protein
MMAVVAYPEHARDDSGDPQRRPQFGVGIVSHGHGIVRISSARRRFVQQQALNWISPGPGPQHEGAVVDSFAAHQLGLARSPDPSHRDEQGSSPGSNPLRDSVISPATCMARHPVVTRLERAHRA